MDANQLLVIDVQGSAGLVQADGSIKALSVGDVITVGDTVVTADNSTILIDVQGESLAIPANKSVTITPDLLAKETQDNSENTLFDDSIDEAIASLNQPNQPTPEQQTGTDISDFLDALEGGGDILDNLEATAAGGGGGAASGGGTSFVELARIAEGIDPSSLAFDDSFNADNTGIFSPRDTTDGVVPGDELIATLSVNELGLTNNPQPVISGTSENLVGQTVTVTVTDANGNTQVVTVVVQPDGTFVTPPLDPLPDGPITVDVVALDPNGDPVSDNIGASIDTVAPVVTIDTLTDSAIQNVLITGTVSGISSGDTVTITVTDSAGQVQVIATQVDDQGNWSITTEALAEGLYTVVASAVDEAGNEGSDSENGLVDLTAPVISIDTIGETNDTTPTISGTVSGVTVGSEITVVITGADNTVQTVTAIVAEDGSWIVDVPDALVEGEFTVTATAVDIAGNEAQATTTGVIDNTAPVISITPIDDTQDTTPNISGNVVGVQQGTLVTVVVTDINGQVQTLTTVTDADGNWSLDVVADLAEGIFDVSASVTDAAGNTAQADTQGVVDLTAPDITLTAIANTNDTTPTFVGRVEGVPEGTEVTIQVVDSNGQSQTLTALVLADGSYSVDAISPLPEGSFTAIATVSDAAGNSASANTTGTVAFSPISITIDSIADSNDTTPLLSGQTDGVATGTTISLTITASDGRVINLLAITQADGSWSIQLTEPLPEGDFTVVASVLDPQGNEAQATAIGNVDLTVSINFIIDTNDTTPSVSGSTQDVEPGAVVTVTFTGSDGATETLQVITDANGNWTVEASTALAEGQFTVTATVTDEVGNTATATEIGVIDLTDPTISINPLNDTNDTTPLISGSVADVPVGTTVTLVITDSNGIVQTITTTTNAQGVWQVETLNELAEGDYTVTASASDEAGNTSSATATGTIDLTAPIININAIADSNDTTPTISGTTQGLNAGSTVTVTVTDSNGSAQVFATVTNADGSWSINIDQELAEGEFTVVAQTQDEAGNSAQDIETGVIDLTAPTITIDEFNDSNDVTPIISGVVSGVDAGSVVTIILVDSNGNQQILTTTVNADSSWQVGANQVLAEGEFTITATVSDPAGNQAQDTTTGIIDLTAPIISLDNLGSSADNTPTISGTVQGVAAGTPVTLVVIDANGNSQTFTAITNDNGVFSADVPGSLADGQYTVTATVSDLAGNQASDSETGTVDSSSLTILIDALGETNDTTPSISGSTLNATAGDVVTVVIIPASGPSQTFTTTVDANGDWSINVSDELAEGEFTIDATVTDQFGNTANDSITAVVDTTAPLISIDTIGAINDSTPLISGSSQGATAGNTVTVTVVDSQNNSQTYSTTVDADGNWAVPVTSAVSQGEFTVTASITDNAGNTGTDTEVGTFDGINPLLTLDFDPLTNDSTPLITGTTDVTAGSIVTVNVTDSDGVVQTLSAVVAADGSWSISPNTPLAEGAFTVTASVEDESGNQTQITQNGVVDLTAPIITIDNLGTVNDTTPTISGQTNEPAGSIVTVVVSDGINSYEFSATVNADGSWSGDVPAELDDGNINVTASITDAAGNQAQATNSFILNSAAPSIAIDAINETNDTTPTISGTSDAPNGSVITIIVEDSNNNSQQLTATVQNGQWSVEIQQALSEGTFTVNASVTVDGLTSDAAAQGVIDVTAPTVSIDALVDSNDVTPIITGQTSGLAAGSVVTLTITDSAGAVQTASVVISQDGSWSAEVSNALAEGQYSVLAEVVDNAGNEASDSQLGITDLSAPTISIDVIANTNDVTPTLTGQTTGVPQGTQVTLLITDSSGNTQTLTTTTLADGSWSVDAEVIIAEGNFTVEASVSDVAGNSASTSATGLIDLTAPTISVDPLSDSADVTPLISGVANGVATGTLVNLEITDSAGNVQTATAIVQADGSWSVEPSVAIAEGEFTVVATVQDTAGNQGSDTATGNIDTTAPSVFIDPQNITNDTTPVFSGQSSGVPAGTEVRLTVTDSAGNIQTLIAITTADGSWSVAATEVLAEGNYTIEAEVSDAAGNTGTDSATGEIDITAPTISLDTLADSNDVTPLISGQTTGAAVGSLVLLTITDSAGNVQSATATVQADGSWSVEPSTALAEGDYTVVATVSDAAGNEGSDTETGTIDVTAPTISIDAPALTNDNTPTVTGTSDLANTSLAVTFTDADGISHSVTVTTDASGNWSAEAGQALADGNYTVSASISDAAGNNSSASDSGEVDTIPPELAFVPTFLLGQLVTLSGTSDLPAGSTVTITQTLLGGGSVTYTATTDANGDWSLTGLTVPLANLASITASASDAAGNVRTISSSDFDGTPPTLTVNVDAIGNDNTPLISGTSDAGEGAQVTVVVTDANGDSSTLTATVDASGNWSVSPTTVLADGQFTVDASVRDGVGNLTEETVTGVIDTVAPSLTLTGVGAGSDVTPEFTGRSNEIGGTVTVTVTDNDGTVQTLTATVDSSGDWRVEVPNGLAEGGYTVSATISDEAGNPTTVNATGSIDTTTPVVVVNDTGLGNDSTPLITGTSTEPAGTVVSLSIVDSNSDTHTVTATVQADGSWQATAPSLPDGAYTVTATIVDAAGNVGTDTGSGSIDTLPPSLAIDSLGTINDDTPTISGTSNEPAGSVVNLSVSDGTNTYTFTATVLGDGTWSADVPSPLNNGSISIDASITDAAGNETTANDTAVLDTTAPSITINVIGETNDTTPTINGTSDAVNGSVVTVVIDDGINPAETLTTTVNGGTWTVTASSALAEGDFTVTATVTENGIDGTATRTGIIDTTMPAIDINALDVTNDTTPTVSGTASAPQGSTVTVVFTDANNNSHTVTTVMQSNGTWSVAASTLLAEGEYTVTATVSDQAGNPATASATGEIDITAPTISLDTLADSNDVTPLISGQTTGAAVGSLVLLTITDSAGNVQSATATVQADGSWSVEPSTALAEGDYTVVATVSDAAGNEGSDTETGTIDVTAPTISIDAPALTNDNTPTVTGTSDLANTSLAVTFTDADGISHSVTVTTDASGNWSAEAGQALADGNYTVSASISDAAGNNSSASDSGEVDTIAPDIRVIPSFLLGNLVGLSGTSDLPEGSVITITEHLVGGLIGLTYTAITDANGDWTLANITVPLLNLAYVTASGTDAAGNTATVSTLDFDNVAPELTVSVAALTNDTTPTISGTTDMGQGTVINVTVQDANGDSQSFTATVQSDQTWSVDVPAELADGTFTVTASVRDQVGNLTTEQTTGVLDSIAPTLSVNAIGGTAEARPTISGSSNEIGGSVVVEIAGQTLTTTVDTDGTWQLVVPVDIVDGSYTITASITDDANNTQTATASITVDTVTPVVLLDALGIGNSSLPVISGTSTESPGTQVSVTITDSNSDTQTLTATVLGDGTWQVTPAALPDGNYTVTASIMDVAGNIGSDTESGSIDTLAPSLTINSLGTTNDSTPTISGTSNEPAGSIVSLSVSNGGNIYSLSATVQIDGTWSVDVVTPLDDGSVTITASITDAANNTTTATDNATLDTNAPTVSIGTLAITNDTTPIISGTSDAVDGTQVTINVEDALGNTQTITTTVTGGIWSVELATVLSEGQYTVDASVTENGLTGTASKVGEIDLTAPSILVNAPAITNDTTPTISGTSDAPQGSVVTLVVSDSLGNDVTASAIVNASGNWSVALPSSIAEGAYTVEASISDAAGNSATTSVSGIIDITAPDVVIDTIAVATDLTPLASGSATGAVAGNRVVVTFVDAAGVSHSVETTLDSSLNWEVEATQALAEGQYTVTAVVTDTAGNDGSVSTTSAVDTTAPIVSIDQSSLILTNDSTPVISGTSDAANSTVVIVFTAAGGLQHTVTTTTDASGNWQVEAGQALADGVYSVTASITDTAGNTGTDSKTGGEVDTVAPELSITPSFLLGNLVSLSGTSDLPEGSVITITNYLIGGGIGVPYTATVDANGDWQVLNLSVSLLTLAYVEASATDAAGNTTTISSIDYSNDPSLDAFDVTNYNPGILGLLLPFAEGTAEPGTEVYAIGSNLIGLNLLNIIDASVLSSSPSTTTDSDGDWSIGLSFLDLGNEYYFAIVDTETGEYIVKNTSNDLVGTGVIESEPDSGIISLGEEPVLAGLENSEEPPENESSTSGAEQLGESIDLSVILAKADTEPTLHSNSAPLEVTIDDVLSDSEQSEVLALNIDSEQQSLAFDPNDSISSQPASDIQSESEDMIKKLIEDGNKSVDI